MNGIKFIQYFWWILMILLLNSAGAAFAQSGKPVFVLVHGAWHGGWCWQDVRKVLDANDYLVYTPSLSGLGEHKNELNEGIDLQTHITDIVNLIEMEDLHHVILVGHSYAGAVIAGVADRIPERLEKLVYLDAMIVHNGESPLTVQLKEDQAGLSKILDTKQHVPAIPAIVFGVTDSLKARWVNERLTVQPYATFKQKLVLKHALGNNIPLVYIACTKPQLPVLKKMSDEAKNNPMWKHYSLDTGHDAMITAPDELSKLLLGLVQK